MSNEVNSQAKEEVTAVPTGVRRRWVPWVAGGVTAAVLVAGGGGWWAYSHVKAGALKELAGAQAAAVVACARVSLDQELRACQVVCVWGWGL